MTGMQRKLVWLSIYAIAMAYLEAALVVYLRELYYPDNLLVIFPPKIFTDIDLGIELAREAGTVVMIIAVAALAERGFMRRFAAFVYVFGLWDIFYYVWLKLTIGWPVSWLEWDILFLIPWAWLGPWLAPVLIATLFVVWGAWVLASRAHCRFERGAATLFVLGALLGVAAFLQPAFTLLPQGVEGFRQFRPGTFWWGLFVPGYVLMAVGLARLLRRSQ